MPSRDSVRERLARLLNCSSRCRLLLGCCTSTGAGADSSLCFMNKKIRGDKKKRYDCELEGVLLFPIESTYLYLTLESSYDEFHSSIGRVNGLKKCLRPLLIFLFETDFLYIDKLDKKKCIFVNITQIRHLLVCCLQTECADGSSVSPHTGFSVKSSPTHSLLDHSWDELSVKYILWDNLFIIMLFLTYCDKDYYCVLRKIKQ